MPSIKTIIKYKKGTCGINNGKLYGFVTKDDGRWRGCSGEDSCKKKIVFVDPSISQSMLEGVPYSSSIIPMHSDKGFIAIAVSPLKFKARILTQVKKGDFKVHVKFGMKDIVYDPTSLSEKYTNIGKIADHIRHRMDLQDAAQVAEDFVDSACIVKDLYNRKICL